MKQYRVTIQRPTETVITDRSTLKGLAGLIEKEFKRCEESILTITMSDERV